MADIIPPRRFPCGKKRVAKTTAQRLNELDRELADAETAMVRAQPHRRQFGMKADSPLAGSALGRFILAHSLRREFYDAGEEWATAKRKWLNAMGARGIALADETSGADVSMEVVHEWRDLCLQGETMMVRYGGTDGMCSVAWMAFDDRDFAEGASVRCAVRALAALACSVGRIEPRDLDAIIS